jgi:glycosyltransferase involved in cell wall biosynthesis
MFTPNLVVFSHLRWSFVHQRPQHLLGRLAGQWRITFIEEPMHTEGPPFVEAVEIAENLTVLIPHTPLKAPGFHDDQFDVLYPMIDDWLTHQGMEQTVVWLSTPMALPLAQALDPLCLVYDCMDELSAFKDAPRQLWQRESALMRQAALVLCGGPSLYEARRRLNPNAHCMPNSVDAAHFSSQRLDPTGEPARVVHALQCDWSGPKLGFFGVIDERVDIALVAQVADAHPDWQIVMVGPLVKFDPTALPQRLNIHWLGLQPYARLPHFLAAWDVCLIPFALNESTRFISPAETLEFMAGGKPVVSTAINDVMAMYGAAVEIAHTPASFVRACERLLDPSDTAREVRSGEMTALVAAGSWDRSATKIDALLWEAREAALDARMMDHRGLIPRARQHAAVAMGGA